MVTALLFTTFVTPFEIGFWMNELGDGGFEDAPINFTINRLVDLVFLVDCGITFFLPYRAPHDQGGMMVYDNKKIAKHYLRTWFFIDFFTCIPFDLVIKSIMDASSDTSSDAVDYNAFRLLRMIRIFKLIRIIRASRIINRWQDHVTISYATISLVKFGFLTALLAHWLACAWGCAGSPVDEGEDTAWRSYSQGLTWRQRARIDEDATPFALYGVSLYVAFNNIFGGSCEINPGNWAEFYMQSIMIMCGSAVWAYVIGSACGIVATLDPALIEYRQTMDELNHFCRTHCLPQELVVRLRAYFRNTIHYTRMLRYERLLQKMSTRLRGDAAHRMCEYQLRNCAFLVDPDLEPEFMCNIAIRLRTSVYSRMERVPSCNLFIVERGVVAKRGKLGLSGCCFNKDVILTNEWLRDFGDSIALNFVQTIALSQKDIFGLLPDFPRAHTIIRKAALRIALIRAMKLVSNLAKRAREQANDHSMRMQDVFDLALAEAARDFLHRNAEQQARERVRLSLYLPASTLKSTLLESEKAVDPFAKSSKPSDDAQPDKWRHSKLAVNIQLPQLMTKREVKRKVEKEARASGAIDQEDMGLSPACETIAMLRTQVEETDTSVLELRDRVDSNHDAVLEQLQELKGAIAMRTRIRRRQRPNAATSPGGLGSNYLARPQHAMLGQFLSSGTLGTEAQGVAQERSEAGQVASGPSCSTPFEA